MNRIMLVVIAVIIGCVVNMPQMKLKGSVKAIAFAGLLYLSYAFLNSQGVVEGNKSIWTDIGNVSSDAMKGFGDMYYQTARPGFDSCDTALMPNDCCQGHRKSACVSDKACEWSSLGCFGKDQVA